MVPEESLADYKNSYQWGKFRHIETLKPGDLGVDRIGEIFSERTVVYDTQGNRHAPEENLPHGVYIINGQKVIR